VKFSGKQIKDINFQKKSNLAECADRWLSLEGFNLAEVTLGVTGLRGLL